MPRHFQSKATNHPPQYFPHLHASLTPPNDGWHPEICRPARMRTPFGTIKPRAHLNRQQIYRQATLFRIQAYPTTVWSSHGNVYVNGTCDDMPAASINNATQVKTPRQLAVAPPQSPSRSLSQLWQTPHVTRRGANAGYRTCKKPIDQECA